MASWSHGPTLQPMGSWHESVDWSSCSRPSPRWWTDVQHSQAEMAGAIIKPLSCSVFIQCICKKMFVVLCKWEPNCKHISQGIIYAKGSPQGCFWNASRISLLVQDSNQNHQPINFTWINSEGQITLGLSSVRGGCVSVCGPDYMQMVLPFHDLIVLFNLNYYHLFIGLVPLLLASVC